MRLRCVYLCSSSLQRLSCDFQMVCVFLVKRFRSGGLAAWPFANIFFFPFRRQFIIRMCFHCISRMETDVCVCMYVDACVLLKMEQRLMYGSAVSVVPLGWDWNPARAWQRSAGLLSFYLSLLLSPPPATKLSHFSDCNIFQTVSVQPPLDWGHAQC